ncbi:hypothetical protein BGZ82_010920 [Podila clonocystis]|nr:hypothetical protein BGZ82_010920 [Podila clonocystis]
MTSTISASLVAKAPHVNLGKDTPSTKTPFRTGATLASKTASPLKISTTSRVTSPPPTSPTSPTPNRRFSGIQSKVGSLEAINYKPKPSEKKIQSFKQDFSHIKAKVDHSAPASIVVVATTTSSPTSPLGSPVHSPPTRPVRTTSITSTSAAARLASRATPSTSRPVSMSVRTGGPQHTVAAISLVSPVHSPPSSRRSSASSTLASSTMSPASPTSRRLSKHIIPTQKVDYSNVRSKVGSLENVGYKSNVQRPGSRSSSEENEERGRSQSPGAQSTTSSGNNSIGKAGGARRSSAPSTLKIPKSKKVDYSNVRSKVGSMEFVSHVPQGGNIRVFSEKLSFREQAQSKIAKEINIAEFYQGDKSFDTLLREEEEAGHGSRGNSEDGDVLDQDISEIYSDLDDLQDLQPPKSLLAVLEEVTENVGTLELEEQIYQGEQYQQAAVAN